MLDDVKIFVSSGNGGDGIVAFLREKFMPRGGPAGGDGGKGGDVIIKVNPRLNTLAPFQRGVHFKAEHGKPGRAKNMSGASGANIEIEVPPGTVIKDAETGQVIADLVRREDRIVVAKGGRGGRGNQHFATSSNQTPRMAEKGAPGQEHWLILELKLIADVGLVGVPNAGKSTLLSVISNARPKIADYPFTTLEPNLGVMLYDDRDLVVADIPGLIEGAHMGVGLGHSFLRHVQRTRVLVHLLNGASEDPIADYSQINSELALYDEKLAEKPQIVVFTKMDLPEAQERWLQVKAFLNTRGVEPISISAATQQNIKPLIQRIFATVDALPPVEQVPVAETPLYELPEEEVVFTIVREDTGVYRVSGRRIERAASMTHWDYEDAIMRFQQILETLGISAALEEAGVQVGDTVYIGDYELEWAD
ncbi:MAG: GTPase ObgE [Anaerolineaceae bacterium]|nr:GTPase ObgE [Anaerolineaceae bacterium]